MSWTNIETKHNQQYNRTTVNCEEPNERLFLIETVLNEFPHYSRAKVMNALDRCCKAISAPRPRSLYLDILEHELGFI